MPNEKVLCYHPEDRWMSCTLCRTARRGASTLNRALQRKIDWPQPKAPAVGSPIQDPLHFTTIDDAFSSVLQYMTTTTRQCRRYYHSCPPVSKNPEDCLHCNRFHTPQYTEVQRANPLSRAEDVHVVVAPGTYSVTAGEWGTQRQQTHVVHVDKGQSANITFTM
ncbi:A-kinase-interacting protein 1-like isoform X3 [Branchiostoma floridae x Branchiostoma japonicum]|uniref:A-kinase interacting protein 1 n=1 Tax=Branchiostoma floridae TaxID=7739 RepID=C3ZUW0_BRAFL|eukprot:XP_002587649.1 hypothetical protein BRAFLDRAFT_127976 [Branchiostoma floridae]